MTEKAITTYHAQQRTKDRLGLSKKLADKKANEALQYGFTREATSGNFYRYLTTLYHGAVNNIRVYNRHVYVFEGNILVTILHLPQRYRNAADKKQRRINGGYKNGPGNAERQI